MVGAESASADLVVGAAEGVSDANGDSALAAIPVIASDGNSTDAFGQVVFYLCG